MLDGDIPGVAAAVQLGHEEEKGGWDGVVGASSPRRRQEEKGKKVSWGVKGIQRGLIMVSDMGGASRSPANTHPHPPAHTHTCSRLGLKFYQQSCQL